MSELTNFDIEPKHRAEVAICIPVFDDWASVSLLLCQIDQVAPALGGPVYVLLVDDGSTDTPPNELDATLRTIERVDILKLRRNVGHQRAIALGLSFIHECCACNFVVVMDGDGEDPPSGIELLLATCREAKCSQIVFARRRKRAEGFLFRGGYLSFRLLHFLLVGRGVNVGNFSAIPASLLGKVVGISEVWNHYAAGVFHARLPLDSVPIDRAPRLMGKSKMNFVSLVTHGMSAISVYGDIVGVRLLCLTSFLMLLALAGLGTVVGLRFFTNLAIAGWAPIAFGVVCIVLANLAMLAMVFVLYLLQSRNLAGFIPLRDWRNYVDSMGTLHGA